MASYPAVKLPAAQPKGARAVSVYRFGLGGFRHTVFRTERPAPVAQPVPQKGHWA